MTALFRIPVLLLRVLSDLTSSVIGFLALVLAMGVLALLLPCLVLFQLPFGNPPYIYKKLIRFFSLYYTGLLHWIVPGLRYRFDRERIGSLRGCIIVANHLSHFDALYLLRLNKRTVAVIKERYFRIPLLGWVINLAGFVPTGGPVTAASGLQRLAGVEEMLRRGGNLLVFPEGTRSSDGKLQRLRSGAMKLAEKYGVPIAVVRLEGTGKLLQKGTFRLQTLFRNTITVELRGILKPGLSREKMAGEICGLLRERVKGA